MAIVPVGIFTRGLGRVILGPCAPNTVTFLVLIMSFMVYCVVGICKTPRPNLRVYLGFCVCSLGFSFCLVLFSIYSQRNFVIFKTFTHVKWKKGSGKKKKRKKTCLFLSKSGTSPRRRERFQLAPKITKIYE